MVPDWVEEVGKQEGASSAVRVELAEERKGLFCLLLAVLLSSISIIWKGKSEMYGSSRAIRPHASHSSYTGGDVTVHSGL